MTRRQKGEGFPGQRIVVWPRSVIWQAQSRSLLRGLMPTDAGYFPRAKGHVRRRSEPINQAIFLYCLRGRGWCELAGQTREVTAGELLVLPPGHPHAYGADTHEPWTIFWVHAQGEHLDDFLAGLGVDPGQPLVYLGEDPQILALFEELLEVQELGYTPQQILHASQALAHLLAVMVRHRQENWRSEPDTWQKINRTLDYMKEHLDRPLMLDQLAALANLSRSRYSALFKARTGFAPMDYFNRLRMHQACQLLDTTAWSIKTIAARLGYEDPLYFSRVFRQVTEASPQQYRQQRKG